MKKMIVIHPFLFAIYPILFLYSHNIHELSIDEIILPSAITITFSIILWFLVSIVIKDKNKIGLLITLILVLFFSYGHVYYLTKNLYLWGMKIGRHSYHFLLWAFLFFVLSYIILKSRKNLVIFTKAFNVTSIILIIFLVTKIGIYEIQRIIITGSQPKSEVISNTRLNENEKDKYPDIYYIIFDRYANSQILQNYFDFNNSEFTNYLISKGFYIATESRANYPSTFQSLASSLNFTHLTHLSEKVGINSNDRTHIFRMLQDFKVWRFLKTKGYKFIQIGSWWGVTRKNRYADLNFGYRFYNLSEFSEMLIESTMLNLFYFKSHSSRYRNAQINHTPNQFKKLVEVQNIPGNKFIFAHFLLPHKPFVFGPNGEILNAKKVRQKDNKENYLNQLLFANASILQFIDEVLSKSAEPPIIILQSDEGPCESFSELKNCGSKTINWTQVSDDGINIHMKILNAYYLPGINENILYPKITPINTFRLIFNSYFGADFDLLPDESYVFEDGNHPYKFINVTEKLK